MYDTFEEAKEAASKFIGQYDVPPVVTETKMSEKARTTTFGFRFFVNETFNSEWVKSPYGYYTRMVEVLN